MRVEEWGWWREHGVKLEMGGGSGASQNRGPLFMSQTFPSLSLESPTLYVWIVNGSSLFAVISPHRIGTTAPPSIECNSQRASGE